MTQRTRFTIAVEHEVYEVFADMAQVAGVSLSRCIGDWLRDTVEAAQMTSIKMREVRESPQRALERYQATVDDRVAEILDDPTHPLHLEAERHLRSRRGAPRPQVAPPSSNTGGKSSGKTRKAA